MITEDEAVMWWAAVLAAISSGAPANVAATDADIAIMAYKERYASD